MGINGAGSNRKGPYRAALAAVIILSVLLVAAIIAVVFGFVRQYRIYHQGQKTAAPAATSATPSAAAAIQLSPGSHIVSSSDLSTGKRLQQIKDGAP